MDKKTLKKRKIITKKDLKIIEKLAVHGPRNLSDMSRELKLPESSLRYRILQLMKRDYLRIHTLVYHTRIGLKKTIFFADVDPLYWDNIYELLDANGYWIFLHKALTTKPAVYALYVIPSDKTHLAEKFFNEMKEMHVIDNFKVYYSTCFHRVYPMDTWFDEKKARWIFKWRELIDTLDEQKTKLPETLRDPSDFPILADLTDLKILAKLEIDATKPFAEIANEIGTTTQNVRYHYYNHILKYGLIEGYEIYIRKYRVECPVVMRLVVDFPGRRALARFANALIDKPFTEIMGKILGKDSLYVNISLPGQEVINFIHVLNELVKLGHISGYEFYISPLELKGKRQTIPYKGFNGYGWEYLHDEMISELYRRVKMVGGELAGDRRVLVSSRAEN